MSIEFNASGNTTFVHQNALANGTLAASPGEYSVAFWAKPVTWAAGQHLFTVSSNVSNNSAIRVTTFGSDAVVFKVVANGSEASNSELSVGSGWHLIVVNFDTTVGASGFTQQHSIDGEAFGHQFGSSSTSVGINNILLGAGLYSSSVSGHSKWMFAYPAICSGHYTNAHVTSLWGSGPSAGDALAPWLVNTANVLTAQSFKDGTLTGGDHNIGSAWQQGGADLTGRASDNPVLIESVSGGGGRRRRRRYIVVRG